MALCACGCGLEVNPSRTWVKAHNRRGIRGNAHPAWKGGRVTKPDGYVKVYSPSHPRADCDGYVPEHRLVMEQVLGRPLLGAEVVHHQNGKRADNRPENLEVLKKGEHTTHHNLGRPQSKLQDRDGLYRQYWHERQTATQIANALGVSKTTVLNRLKAFGVPRRVAAPKRQRQDLKPVGAPNPTIECGCGCGATFSKYGRYGVPRGFLRGHNSRINAKEV